MSNRSNRRHRWVARILALAAVVAVAVPLLACETPVYRYAMYRWQPAPFEVYHFHRGELSPEEMEIHRELLAIAGDDENPLNCSLINVDLDADPELKRVLPDIKASWTANQDELSPGYLVTNPRGSIIHAGSLDKSQLKQLADSPTRKTLGESLGQGHAVVFVLLTGKDDAENKAARMTLTSLIRDVKDKKISLYTVPQEEDTDEDGEASKEAKTSHTLAKLELDRNDKSETTLVRTLLAIEPDLAEIELPMVFPVYGRARALEPYIGKGIHRDNLVECVEFVTGACSCTVKEQNPGMDLLMRFDWESAAAHVADLFGSEEGNETQFGGEDFFPELIIAPAAPKDESAGDDVQESSTNDSTTLVAANDGDEKDPAAEAQETNVAATASVETVAKTTGVLTLGVIIMVVLVTFLLLTVFMLRSR